MKKKRHSSAEIAAKLRQADAMRREGMPAGKVAQALGISVMTYHRWRKAREPLPGTAATARERSIAKRQLFTCSSDSAHAARRQTIPISCVMLNSSTTNNRRATTK